MPNLRRLVLILVPVLLSGYFLLPGGSVADTALVTHTAGSSQAYSSRPSAGDTN